MVLALREILIIYLEIKHEFTSQGKTPHIHWEMKKHGPGPLYSLQSGGDDDVRL